MMTLDEKFKALQADNAPGQEVRQNTENLNALMRGEKLEGILVDFTHGDVNAFHPTPNSEVIWKEGFDKGAKQAYTEYRGLAEIRKGLAERLATFTNKAIDFDSELIVTSGTQGALFLALGATVSSGIKVGIVEPDYYANRKMVKFFGGEVVPIPLNYLNDDAEKGLDLKRLEDVFKEGVSVLVFSTPNNPTGFVYSKESLTTIATLAKKYDVTLIVDQLYSRMLYSNQSYSHLRSFDVVPDNVITIMGPSKTESLSGFRLGVAFGTAKILERMERLQAIMCLRASGYNQAVLETWFQEPEGWLKDRIAKHEAIRDALLKVFRGAGYPTATPQAGSYLFPQLPPLSVDIVSFTRLLRIQANVLVTPGVEFDPSITNSIRLNFSQDHTAAVDAAHRIVKMVEIYKL